MPRVLERLRAVLLGGRVTRVVIDPGHGGKDPGAVVGALREADLNLRVAHTLKAIFDTHAEFDASLTRERNVTVPLADRVAPAKGPRTVLLSIHFNAAEDRRANGAEVWCFSTTDVRGKETLGFRIARSIQERLVALGIHNRGARPIFSREEERYVFRKLYVLRKSTVPAVLIECCFLTNHNDAARLGCRYGDFTERLAVAIYAGVEAVHL